MRVKAPNRRLAYEAILIALLALVPIVFWRGTYDSFEVPKTSLLATGALLIGACALAGELSRMSALGAAGWIRLLGERLRSAARRDPLGAAILLYLGSATASTFTSPNPMLSFLGAPDSNAGLTTALSTATVYYVSRSLGGSPKSLRRIALAATGAAALAAGYALVQLAGRDPLIWGGTATFGGKLRVFGTLAHPNLLGAYLGMCLPLIAWLAVRTNNVLGRAACLLIAAASISVIAATLSRAAWMGVAASFGVWLFFRMKARHQMRESSDGSLRPRANRTLAVSAAALILIAAPAIILARSPLGPLFLARMRSIASLDAPSTQSRLQIWGASLRMAADKPVLGVGLEAFELAYPGYRTAESWRVEWGGSPTKAHDEAMDIVATQGALGGVAALLVVLLAARAAWRATHNTRPAIRAGAVSATAALAGFAVQDLAGFTVAALGTLAAALAGWLSAAGEDAPAKGPTVPPPSTRSWALVFAGLLAAFAFVPLVLIPWRAASARQTALQSQPASSSRNEALARGGALVPWDAYFPARLARSLLTQAAAESDPSLRRGLLVRARTEAEKAIRIEPQNGIHYSRLGHILGEQARLEPPQAKLSDMQVAFSKASARDPVNSDILLEATEAYLEIGQVAEARQPALHCATLYPGLAHPVAMLGYAALQEGRTADAVDTLTLALSLNWRGEPVPEANAWVNLSAAHLQRREYDKAQAAAERALKLNPASRAAANNRDRAIRARNGELTIQLR